MSMDKGRATVPARADTYAELRRLAEAATPGPWRRCGADGCPVQDVWSVSADQVVVCAMGPSDDLLCPPTREAQRANAAFVAEADPQQVLALLDEIRSLRRERDAMAATLRNALDNQGDEFFLEAARDALDAHRAGTLSALVDRWEEEARG